jgi:fatty acid desaturase
MTKRTSRRIARELISDLCIVGGTAATAWGLWQIFPPSAWIFGGLAGALFGYFLGRNVG